MIEIVIYGALIGFLLLLGIIYHSEYNVALNKKRFVVITCSLLFVVMALRALTVGTDVKNVVMIFMLNRPVFINGVNGFVYNLISKIGYMFAPFPQTILIINAAIICGVIAYFVYNNSKDAFLSIYLYITLYFYFSSFNIMRQYDAIAMCLMCYTACEKRKRALAILFAFLAFFIHSTSIVFFIALVAYKTITCLKRIDVQIVFGVILTFVLGYVFEPLLALFAKVFPHYEMYIGDAEVALNAYQSDGKKVLITLMFAGILEFSYATIIKTERKNSSFLVGENVRIQLFFLMIAVALGFAGARLQLIARMESYFSVYAIILIPEFIRMIQARYRKIIYFFFVFVMLVPMFVQLKSNSSGVVPYATFF